MATQASVRREISRLREQLRQQSQKQEAERRRLEAQYNNRIRQTQEQIRLEVERSRREMDARVTARIRDLREQLHTEMQAQVNAIHQADREAQRQREALMKELERINQQLREELRDIQTREQQRTDASRSMAEQLRRAADSKAAEVEELPHEFFCPGQLKIYQEHLYSAEVMFNSEMFEASASTADAALAELEVLEITVAALQEEWELLFHVYQRQVQRLLNGLKSFEEEELQTPCGSFRLTEEERAYWSSGNYPVIRQRILDSAQMLIQTKQAENLTEFLSSGAGVKGFQMTQLITDTSRLADQFTAMTSCIRSERYYSDERYQLGQIARQLFVDAGYQILSAGFRGEPEHPLDSYDVEATINRIDMVHLTFLPRRRDGVAYQNACILSVDVHTVPNQQVIQSVKDETRRMLQPQMQNIEIAAFQAGEDSIVQTERRLAQTPDPLLLAKRLERKYQN